MKPNMKLFPALSLLVISLFFPLCAFGQGEENLKGMFVEAESYFLFEEYKDALPLYQRLLQADPENFNLNYKIGICYLNDIFQLQKSISYLEKAVKGINPASKTTSFKEKQAPPEAYYYLGNAYRVNNRLDEAIEAYEQFKLVLDPLVYDTELLDAQITSCKVAAIQESKPMFFISANLGETINERFEELNPVISGDESVLVFTRKLQFYDAIFYSRKENGKWSFPVNLTPSLGVDDDSYCTGLSYNGDELFVYRSDNFDGNLYVSNYKNGKWSKLAKLNANINTKYWESHASLSRDGKTLYFTSNRAGGYGGLDIYRSERTRNGDWGPAVNLGPVINSKYNEDTPFVTEDGNTLYFSSLGHYNMGGYDIFYSTRLDNGQWAKPINAGYPLNTTNDDQFFVPVKDGAFAYYSKYNVDDTYGLTDIYKLEVFTDLHPRKFILKGLARVEGQVRPDFSQFTAILVNPRTGNVVDQAKLEDDGSYTLDALSGDLELQFKGKDIESKVEKLNIPINNPSNIVSHTTVLTSLISPVVAPVLAEETVPAGPELGIAVREYVVTSGQSIPIRLDLERNTKLKVETLLDGELMKTEDFDIKRRRFVYMLTPKPGTNILRFTLTDAEGRSSTDEVTVIYTPSEEAVVAAPAPTVISEADRYLGLAMMAQGNLEKFMNSDEFRNQHFDSMADLYEYLAAHAAENNFTLAEVEELLARFLSQKELGYFYTELKAHSSDSLVKTLEKLDLKSKNIYTSEALLDYLYKNAASYTYNLDDLREALYQIAAANRDPLALVELLASYSQGSLADVLNRMKQDIKSFPNTRTVADYLLAGAQKGDFPVADLELALRKAAAELDMYFLYEGLLFISGDSLQNTLLGIDMKTENIRNSLELITFLMSQSDKGGYTKRELIDNIEKIRKDPYYYVDLFRRMLAEKATGSLKVFLQEIDIRGLEINTFEELVDYLLNQSQFHDFNREMVYQLLIDIIDPRNVKEFIDMLKLYGDERITRAINATDTEQFSRPIEVMQYLLSVADQYEYTERDLLRILLKMLLRKGPEGADGEDSQGWFAGLNKPALVTSLIVVNALIIIILILFIWRKKKKNDEVIGKE